MPVRKILFVEDEPDIRLITRSLLLQHGIEVHDFSSGSEALACAEDLSPDLILMDLMLRGMDGVETLNGLRELGGLEQTPCVFLTAMADVSTIKSLNRIARSTVISKPYHIETFVGELNAFYQRSTGRKVNSESGSKPSANADTHSLDEETVE